MRGDPPGWDLVAKLAQAMGMVSVQAGCTLDEALTIISDRAIVHGCSAYDIASATVDRRIRFGPERQVKLSHPHRTSN